MYEGNSPVPSMATGPVLSSPMAHIAISILWAPQSVIFPPEYSSHQRKFAWPRSLVNSTFGAGPSHKSQSRSLGAASVE